MMSTACTSGQAVFVSDDMEDEDMQSRADDASEEVSDSELVESVHVYSDEKKIAVYVCGAVANPGVYYLSIDAIKKDALDAAGGFIEGAAESYVNLAEGVAEGEQIYIPYEEELNSSYSPLSGESESGGMVNINTATAEVLMTLPGIGESKADAIIKYREQHGAFNSIEDIKNISGIKDGVYDNIKDLIVVN